MAPNATPSNSSVATTQKSIPIPKTLVEPKSKAVDFASRQVKIKVGTPATIYYVNKQLLCDSSEFFLAALGPRWVEGKTGVVDMPHDDADAFNIYLNWLHRGVLPVELDESKGHLPHIWDSITSAYALGDKLLDVSFKDATTDAVAGMITARRSDGCAWVPGGSGMLHERLAYDSKLNLLIAHKSARLQNASEMVDITQPAGFLLNFAKELIRVGKESPLELTMDAAARCAFHEHAPGAENCYRSKRG